MSDQNAKHGKFFKLLPNSSMVLNSSHTLSLPSVSTVLHGSMKITLITNAPKPFPLPYPTPAFLLLAVVALALWKLPIKAPLKGRLQA